MSDPLMLQEAREFPRIALMQAAHNRDLLRELARRIQRFKPRFVATIARGSSDHAAQFVKYAFETQLGWPVVSVAPSVVSAYHQELQWEGALVIAISQSGASPDVVEPLEQARKAGALTVALVNSEDSPLAQAAEFVVPLRAGEEKAVAATKSFLASLTGALQLLQELALDATLNKAMGWLPEALQSTLELESLTKARAERFRFVEHLVVLGRGMHLAIANETALKLKETSGIFAQAYSAAEFSHGPMRVVREGFPVLCFQGMDETRMLTSAACLALKDRGADLTGFGCGLNGESLHDIRTMPTGHRLTDPLPAMLAAYFFAAHLSLHRGLNPDAPPSLQKVTLTR